MKSKLGHAFTAYVGLDWADTKHDICIQSAHSDSREFDIINHSTEAIEQWALELHQRFGGKIAIALELAKGPIVYALQKYAFFVIFPVHPATLADYRKTFRPSGAKDDPTDAEFIVDLILRHPEHFKPLQPQSATMRMLVTLVEQRRVLVDERTRITNRLRSTLKQYYPQTIEWFPRLDSVMFCDFLKRWPSLQQVKKARKNTLITFFHAHNLRFAHILEARLASIKTASPLTTDDAVIRPYRLHAEAMVEQLLTTISAIERYDQEIKEVASTHQDFELFSQLPSAGPVYAPRLMAAFGEDRKRYSSANEVQQYAGIAPVLERSGNTQWVHWRWQCSKFLRQTFVEWSAHTINTSYWAGVYYRQQRSKGRSHHVAVRSLAYKWIRILFRCWQTRTPYDESKYLNALARRGSPLVAALETTASTA